MQGRSARLYIDLVKESQNSTAKYARNGTINMPKRSAWQIMGFERRQNDAEHQGYPSRAPPRTNLLVRKEPANPTDGQAEDQKQQRQRIPFFDPVHLRQDIGCGDGQKSAGGYANGNGDIFRRQRAEK